MEQGNRVQEIRRRFEGLSSQKNDSCSSQRQLGNEEVLTKIDSSTKGGIKRSHAFRSDKSKLKLLNLNSTSSNSSDSVRNLHDGNSQKSLPQSEKLLYSNALKTSHFNALKLSNRDINRKEDPLTDTLKKALKNPLPPGPAPKKPPRTFAHVRSIDLEEGQKNIKFNETLSKFESPPRTNDNLVAHKNVAALSQRSKTEPHIMLKKLETALLIHQANNAAATTKKEEPSIPVVLKKNLPNKFSTFGAKTLCLNGFSSCMNKNIYDTPFESKYKTELLNSVKIVSPPKPIAYGKIQNSVGSHNIYEEPYSPKSVKKFGVLPVKNCSQLTAVSHKPSVHYMSTPVCETNKTAFRDALIPVSPPRSKDEKIKMVTDVFNDNGPSDSDAESLLEDKNGNPEEVTAVRKVYAQRVSSMRRQAPRVAKRENLLEALVLVGIDQDLTLGKVPYVKMKFPESAELVGGLGNFVFPDAGDWPPEDPATLDSRRHHNYSLPLTGEDGSRRFAYCRRLRPEGAPYCLPLAYALLTPHKDNVFYYSILAELETRHGVPENEFLQFAKALYYSNFPRPGFNLRIGDTVFQRPIDPRKDSFDITTLLQRATVPVFIKIFSSLLIERKVIIIGSNISTVSDCLEGLQKALFPFEWEHTLVGAVPPNLLELTEAPTPFLLGIIRPKGTSPSSVGFLPLKTMDHCLVADLESGEVLVSCSDEGSLLPSRLAACLRSALYLCPVGGPDIAPSEALIRLFVELVGHYNNHVVTSIHTNNRTFQREAFVKAPKSRSHQQFLDWFTETAMFQSFIQKRLSRSFEPGLFEQRCAEYIEENVKNHVSKKEKSLNKTVKILGDRFKDWASSS